MRSDGWDRWVTVKKLDALHQVQVFYMDVEESYYKHRYEERGDKFSLRSWADPDRETTIEGDHTGPDFRPQWLTDIINVAIIGGHYKCAPQGPHHAIVWFRTDASRTLIDFIDFTKA